MLQLAAKVEKILVVGETVASVEDDQEDHERAHGLHVANLQVPLQQHMQNQYRSVVLGSAEADSAAHLPENALLVIFCKILP